MSAPTIRLPPTPGPRNGTPVECKPALPGGPSQLTPPPTLPRKDTKNLPEEAREPQARMDGESPALFLHPLPSRQGPSDFRSYAHDQHHDRAPSLPFQQSPLIPGVNALQLNVPDDTEARESSVPMINYDDQVATDALVQLARDRVNLSMASNLDPDLDTDRFDASGEHMQDRMGESFIRHHQRLLEDSEYLGDDSNEIKKTKAPHHRAMWDNNSQSTLVSPHSHPEHPTLPRYPQHHQPLAHQYHPLERLTLNQAITTSNPSMFPQDQHDPPHLQSQQDAVMQQLQLEYLHGMLGGPSSRPNFPMSPAECYGAQRPVAARAQTFNGAPPLRAPGYPYPPNAKMPFDPRLSTLRVANHTNSQASGLSRSGPPSAQCPSSTLQWVQQQQQRPSNKRSAEAEVAKECAWTVKECGEKIVGEYALLKQYQVGLRTLMRQSSEMFYNVRMSSANHRDTRF